MTATSGRKTSYVLPYTGTLNSQGCKVGNIPLYSLDSAGQTRPLSPRGALQHLTQARCWKPGGFCLRSHALAAPVQVQVCAESRSWQPLSLAGPWAEHHRGTREQALAGRGPGATACVACRQTASALHKGSETLVLQMTVDFQKESLQVQL